MDALLDATLNERNPDAVDKYLCSGSDVGTKFRSIIGKIKSFQKANPDTFLTYNWNITKKSESKDRAVIAAEVRAKTTFGQSSIDNPPQLWTFDMRNQSGWKVCGLKTPQ